MTTFRLPWRTRLRRFVRRVFGRAIAFRDDL